MRVVLAVAVLGAVVGISMFIHVVVNLMRTI